MKCQQLVKLSNKSIQLKKEKELIPCVNQDTVFKMYQNQKAITPFIISLKKEKRKGKYIHEYIFIISLE